MTWIMAVKRHTKIILKKKNVSYNISKVVTRNRTLLLRVRKPHVKTFLKYA